MQYIRKFNELRKEDVSLAGGKGASLGEMTQQGIPVPPGFVVLTTSFQQFISLTQIDEQITQVLNSTDSSDVMVASKTIRELISTSVVPKEIEEAIMIAFDNLNTPYVAVRSSATSEDGAQHAWAGQLDSYLNTTKETLIENVKNCWASLFTPRALLYRFEKGLRGSDIGVAVVIQKMVESEMAGVAFSVHPITQNSNEILIEAGYGLGEAVVSGEITPDTYVLEKESTKILDVKIATQAQCLVRDIKGGNVWSEVQSNKVNLQKLENKQVVELAKLIIEIEKHYGFPCDIEWAYEKGEFYIVQCRPITTLQTNKIVGKRVYKLIFGSDGFAVLNTFNLKNAGYIRFGGVLTAEHNKKVSLYIKSSDLEHYGKAGYDMFVSKDKTQKLIDDVEELVKKITYQDELHVGNTESYSDAEIAQHLKVTSELSVKFIGLYGLIESHHTYYTEDLITQYINLNHEGLKDTPIFDIIFNEREKIKDLHIKELCDHVALLAQFKLSTKEKMSNLFVGYSALIKEARKRFNLGPTDDLRLLSLEEIQAYLISGFNRAEFDLIVNERKEWFVIKSEDNQEEILFGEEAKKEIERIKILSGLEDRKKSLHDFEGQTASIGKYTGRAVVIPYIRSIEDEVYKIAFAEFKQGDILVTKNSVPEIIEIIKKSAAIVTEEGGITCHGAIMAREFKVPGIVGVDGVVDSINTGDLIEVDATGTRGFVRKLG